jgi:Protein of unknown function (DUF4058)
MPSPFPGMNPYLEQSSVWHDFHNSFIAAARDDIAAQVDPDYFVRIDEQVYIHEWPVSAGRADVAVTNASTSAAKRPAAGIVTAEVTTSNAVVTYPWIEEERLSFLEVRDRKSRRVVTVLELLSPSNKYSGPDREQYLMKRVALLMRDVSLVELDLTRGGPRMPTRNVPASDYSVLVSRPGRRPFADYWAINLRDPLPTIPIPLRADDADAALDIQAVVHRVYDAARYGSSIYDGDPEPALSSNDAEWARQFVPARS